MNGDRSQQLIVGCLAASSAVAAGSALASDGDIPGIRMLVGVGVTGATLAVVSMFNPDLAGAFAVLVLTTTVFVYGGPAMDAVTSLTAPPARKRVGKIAKKKEPTK